MKRPIVGFVMMILLFAVSFWLWTSNVIPEFPIVPGTITIGFLGMGVFAAIYLWLVWLVDEVVDRVIRRFRKK